MIAFLTAFFAAWPTIAGLVNLFIKTPKDKWDELNSRYADLNIKVMDAALAGGETGDYGPVMDLINGARRH